MTGHPDIATALAEGEVLLWQGHPKPGRPVTLRANLIAAALYLATIGLLLGAFFVEIYWGQVPAFHLSVYALVAASAFCTYAGLRVTLLDRRRARARDARTSYAITDRRVLELAGPFTAEMPLDAATQAVARGQTLSITGPAGRMVFDRLDDAATARDILMAQLGGQT